MGGEGGLAEGTDMGRDDLLTTLRVTYGIPIRYAPNPMWGVQGWWIAAWLRVDWVHADLSRIMYRFHDVAYVTRLGSRARLTQSKAQGRLDVA